MQPLLPHWSDCQSIHLTYMEFVLLTHSSMKVSLTHKTSSEGLNISLETGLGQRQASLFAVPGSNTNIPQVFVRSHGATALLARISFHQKLLVAEKNQPNSLIVTWWTPWRIHGWGFLFLWLPCPAQKQWRGCQAAFIPLSPIPQVPAPLALTITQQQSCWTLILLLMGIKPQSPWLNQPAFQTLWSSEAHVITS